MKNPCQDIIILNAMYMYCTQDTFAMHFIHANATNLEQLTCTHISSSSLPCRSPCCSFTSSIPHNTDTFNSHTLLLYGTSKFSNHLLPRFGCARGIPTQFLTGLILVYHYRVLVVVCKYINRTVSTRCVRTRRRRAAQLTPYA